MGIIVQTEIPWVNNCGTEISDAYVRNIYDQMSEMVSSLYNHPSLELFRNGRSVASASKTNEDTGVVWKFPVKMGEAEKISYLCKNILSL